MRAANSVTSITVLVAHLVDNPRVVLCECDTISHVFGSLLLVQPGDLALERRDVASRSASTAW